MIKYKTRIIDSYRNGGGGYDLISNQRKTGTVDQPTDPIITPEKLYLLAREEYDASVTLTISDWKTIGAWEFSVDGQPYQFSGDETLYDALVNLYEYNVAYPHRTDDLLTPGDNEFFSLYNNNPYAVTIYFKYVGNILDPLDSIISVDSLSADTKVRSSDESKSLEIDLAGSKYAYVVQGPLFDIDYSRSYLASGNFYILTINDIEYRYTGTLEELYQYNRDGLEGLLTVYPELIDIVNISDNWDYVSISNKTPMPLVCNIRLDRDLPYTNGVEEVWSKENQKGIYLPTVSEIPSYDEDLQFYPHGVIQEINSVPITVTPEGYSFELAPSPPEPLFMRSNYVSSLNSRTRDSLNLTGTVNYPDTEISFLWNDVKYTATVDTVKVDSNYTWNFTTLPYDIFEDTVNDTPDGIVNLNVIASRGLEKVERLTRISYYKPTVFITPETSYGEVQRVAGLNLVIDWGDGTVENFSNPNGNISPQHTYAVLGSYTITIDRFNNPRGLLWIARNTVGNSTWSSGHSQDNGIKEIVQWESTGYSQLGAGSYKLEKIPNHPPPNTSNFAGFLQGSVNFNQDLTTWEETSPSNLSMVFQGCHSLTSIPPFQTRNCTDFSRAFESCRLLEPDLSNWETSNVTNMSHTFSSVKNFNSDISGWDVSKVTDFSYMFYANELFNSGISGWDVSRGTNFSYMFSGTTLFNQPLNDWDVSNATRMSGMFFVTKAFNQPLNNWVVDSAKTSLEAMFSNAAAFNSDISTWNVRSAIGRMFEQAAVFNQPIGSWPVHEAPGYSGGSMFEHSAAFYQDLSSWVVNYPESVMKNTLVRYELKTDWYPKAL